MIEIRGPYLPKACVSGCEDILVSSLSSTISNPLVVFDDTVEGVIYNRDYIATDGSKFNWAFNPIEDWNSTSFKVNMKKMKDTEEVGLFGSLIPLYINIIVESSIESGNWGYLWSTCPLVPYNFHYVSISGSLTHSSNTADRAILGKTMKYDIFLSHTTIGIMYTPRYNKPFSLGFAKELEAVVGVTLQ